jgi:FlaA1/EpsC-like NDP-sugar epimerase
VTDKVVLVTGAAGSIGSELCTQLVHYKPRRLVCVDQDETALFFLEQKMSHGAMQVETDYCVADVADRQRMRNLVANAEVDCIFHAAAYKHVPMMETNTSEAVRNNIFGLMSLIDVAEQCGCGAFLMISSDKAVNPTNVMGCTKRVCELIMAARPNSRMRRVSVRFGNVLGSQGSVIPVLQEQIRSQRVVTVTHPDITRFFMTIPEAVSLVLQAFTVGKHGEILVLQMGQPMRIVDLARTLIRLCGKTEDDVEIVYSGLRKGEKLHEELFYASETVSQTGCDKVMRTAGKLMSWAVLEEHLAGLYGLIYSGTDSMIRKKLREIVPEYV